MKEEIETVRLLKIFLASVLIAMCLSYFTSADAAEYNHKFKDYSYTVGCINLEDYSIHTPRDSSLNGCHLGRNFMRIMTPTKKQWKDLVEVFGKDKAMDVLPIINAESQFNHSARGTHKYGTDCGIIQIRDVSGGCEMSELQQLKWLKTRMDSQATETGTCRSWLNNAERLIRCQYNRHNGQRVAYNTYDNKLMKFREFYKKSFFSK